MFTVPEKPQRLQCLRDETDPEQAGLGGGSSQEEDRPSGGTSGGRVSRGGGGTLPQGRRRLDIAVGKRAMPEGNLTQIKDQRWGGGAGVPLFLQNRRESPNYEDWVLE